MKMIIAIIPPYRLEAVKRELSKNEIYRLTVINASGIGRQKGQIHYIRGMEAESTLIQKIEIQVAMNDEFIEPTIEAIMKAIRGDEGGAVGDGKIFVLPLEDVIRISDGIRGKDGI